MIIEGLILNNIVKAPYIDIILEKTDIKAYKKYLKYILYMFIYIQWLVHLKAILTKLCIAFGL